MNVFTLRKKIFVLHTTPGFYLIIFENLDKFLEDVCDEIPIQQKKYMFHILYIKEPTPETYFCPFSLQLQ